MGETRLWERILRDSAHKVRYEESHLVLVGERHAGIRSLLTALQRGPGALGKVKYTELAAEGDEPASGPLNYSYLNVKNIEDEHSEKIAKMNVWVLEDAATSGLLDLCLRPNSLKNMIFGLVLDFSQPWSFLSSLGSWMSIWQEKLGKALSALPLQEQDALVEKVMNYVRRYGCQTEEIPPLPEGVLAVNLGVPIVVICTKTDVCWQVDKSRDSAERLIDYITRTLREQCLHCNSHSDGAALIYTSARTGENIPVLYEYLMHRVYGFQFHREAQVLERESTFVPAGWDSPNLIQGLDYIQMPGITFEENLQPPRSKTSPKDEVSYTEDQAFLQQLQATIRGQTRKSVRKLLRKPVKESNWTAPTQAVRSKNWPLSLPNAAKALSRSSTKIYLIRAVKTPLRPQRPLLRLLLSFEPTFVERTQRHLVHNSHRCDQTSNQQVQPYPSNIGVHNLPIDQFNGFRLYMRGRKQA